MKNIADRIIAFNKGRLPDMLQIKYEAMSETLFRFFRGTNHLFYEDLKAAALPESPLAWICGDLHLENFGSFKSDNRLVYFDLNDFDEAALAPAVYELTRVITSIFIAFDTLKIEQKKALNMAQLFLKSYAAVLAKGKTNYIEPRTAKGIVCDFLTAASKRQSKEILKKRTAIKKDRQEILLSNPKHFALKKGLKKDLLKHITSWLKNDEDSPYNYKPVDAAFRLAGTGSLGQKRYVILLKTLNDMGEKYLLIDMKQSLPSSLKPYLQVKQPKWNSEADRIIAIQQRMQNRPPALLSATVFKDEPYVIQEMQPTEDSINLRGLKKKYRDMFQVIDDMAMLTASSQLRSSGFQGSGITDELMAFGLDTRWQEAILNYAMQYTHRIRLDYLDFLNAFKNGDFKQKTIAVK